MQWVYCTNRLCGNPWFTEANNTATFEQYPLRRMWFGLSKIIKPIHTYTVTVKPNSAGPYEQYIEVDLATGQTRNIDKPNTSIDLASLLYNIIPFIVGAFIVAGIVIFIIIRIFSTKGRRSPPQQPE